MKPEAQRIAIAVACGHVEPRCWGNLGWLSKKGEGLVDFVPDYPGDLNAMHEAEKVLNSGGFTYYSRALLNIVRRDCFPEWPGNGVNEGEAFDLVHATAAQRAEAFLRTTGRWNYYESIADYLGRDYVGDFESPESRARCIATDELWENDSGLPRSGGRGTGQSGD